MFEQIEKYDKKRDKAQNKQKADLKNLSEGKVPLKMIFKARKNKFEALAEIEDKIVNVSKVNDFNNKEIPRQAKMLEPYQTYKI